MFRRLILLAALLAAVLAVISGSTPSPATAQAGCSAAYPDFCIPPPPPDLNCDSPAIADRKNFTALAPDPHNLDANNDGVACEDSNRPRFATTTTAAAVTTTTVGGGGSTSNSGAASDASATTTTIVASTTAASTTPTTVRTATPAVAQAPQVIALTG